MEHGKEEEKEKKWSHISTTNKENQKLKIKIKKKSREGPRSTCAQKNQPSNTKKNVGGSHQSQNPQKTPQRPLTFQSW